MIILKAPYPVFVCTIVLPNPKLGDSNTVIREVALQRSIDGTPYSYIKTSSSVRLLYQIELTRAKSLEFEDFVSTYGGVHWHLTDHKNVKYDVIMISELTKQNFKRALYNPTDTYGGEENVTIDIELEGTPL
jgi:hypothetical protein